MLEKYKAGITLFSILTIIAVLFPPVVWQSNNRTLDSEFSFLFSIPNYKASYGMTTIGGSINFVQLFVELILIAVISLLYQVNSEKMIKWFKQIYKRICQ